MHATLTLKLRQEQPAVESETTLQISLPVSRDDFAGPLENFINGHAQYLLDEAMKKLADMEQASAKQPETPKVPVEPVPSLS